MRSRRYTLACLAGSGAGPELMAEASRALAAAARPHGLALDEVHAPFGSAAFVRMGHPLPQSTRRAYRDADAILLAGADAAVAGIEADLDLRAGIAHVVVPGRVDVCVVSPLTDGADDAWALERAFELACQRRGSLTAVGRDERWRGLVDALVEATPGLSVRRLELPGPLAEVAAAAEGLDVVVGDRAFADALTQVAAFGAPGRMVAVGRLAAAGPSLFFADPCAEDADAGHGMADPAQTLLAAALALGEGLGERASARTLERALTAARLGGWRGRAAASARELTDLVLAALPSSVANAEFAEEAAA